jgi:hypothetical protein
MIGGMSWLRTRHGLRCRPRVTASALSAAGRADLGREAFHHAYPGCVRPHGAEALLAGADCSGHHRLRSRMTCSNPERTASAAARSQVCFRRAAYPGCIKFRLGVE